MSGRLERLPLFGLQGILACLLEDFRRTGEEWFLEKADEVRDLIRAREAAGLLRCGVLT